MHPEIIVEEPEDDSAESEDSEVSEEEEKEEEDDVPTPLRPTDTFPFKRRNSPFLGKMSEESLNHLRAINPDLGEPGPAPSPTPTTCSTLSRHEFTSWRINEDVIGNMMQISTICERNQVCKTAKYVYTVTMASYTVTEWTVEGKAASQTEKISKYIEDLCVLRHKRLAPIYGYHWKTEETLMVFRAHVPNGTVADLVKRSALPQETALRYIVHVIDALSYLHERHYVHGKVNASNLLLTISNDIMLADPYIDGLPSPQKRRALLASPPEAFDCWESYPSLTSASDMWSVGCVLVTMVTRYPPFLDHFMHFHGDSLHRELITEWGSRRRLLYTSDNLIPDASKDIKDLVDALFVYDPMSRPSAHTLFDTYGSKSRKTSIRNSLASLTAPPKEEPEPPQPIDEFYVDRENDEEHRQLENLIELAEKMQKDQQAEGGFLPFFWWYLSRIVLFITLLIKWVGMVLCAALSLAVVAGSVFFAIFLIYNGIQIACQCTLNEGFIVLIALILLPIIILLTTLCCNNSLDRYNADVESGKVERSRYVMKTPEKDVVLCGYIFIEGRPREEVENNRKIGITEGLAQLTTRGGDFLSGVARIA